MNLMKRNKKSFGEIVHGAEVQSNSSSKADIKVDDIFGLSFTKALFEELAEDNKWNFFLAAYGAAILLGGIVLASLATIVDSHIKKIPLFVAGTFFVCFSLYIFAKSFLPSPEKPETEVEVEVDDD